MVESAGMTTVKYLMFFFNFLFWLSGLALIIIGAIIRNKYGDYFSYADSSFANVAVFIIVVGVIIAIIGFLGCCGAVKENYCMITTFAVILAIIFILEIVAGAVGFAYKKKVEDKVVEALDRAVQNYNDTSEPGAKDLLDWAQQEFKCCGGPSGQPKAIGNDTCKGDLPKSCFPDEDCSATAYSDNCKHGFTNFVKDNLVVIGAVAIGIAFIQILGIIFSCCMMKAIKSEYEVV